MAGVARRISSMVGVFWATETLGFSLVVLVSGEHAVVLALLLQAD